MIIEALSFKLILDFLTNLDKNGLHTSNIKVRFWDRFRYEFITYQNILEMSSFFSLKYSYIDNCVLGNLCSLQFFEANSSLYDFETQYKAIDITGSYKLITGSSFDIQRNPQRSIFTTRQTSLINLSVSEYLKYLNEITGIYTTGLYSPCYAKPGWSQGTSYLKMLREGLLGNQLRPSPTIMSTISQQIPSNPVINYYEVQKRDRLIRLNQEILIITNRINFIQDIIDGNINMNITPLSDIILYLESTGFDLVNDSYNYLLNMPIYTLNSQSILDLQQLKTSKEAEILIL